MPKPNTPPVSRSSRNERAPLRLTRTEALTLGLNRYFGKPCSKHPESERRTSDHHCVECKRIKQKARWRMPEYRAKRKRAFTTARKARKAATNRVWHLNNKDRTAATNRAMSKINRERKAAIDHARRARERNAPGRFTAADIERLRIEQNRICAGPHCDTPLAVSETIDHKQPITRGGSNWPRNLQLLCQPCNSSKCDRTNAEWRAALKRRKTYEEDKIRSQPRRRATEARCRIETQLPASVDRTQARAAPQQTQAAQAGKAS